MDGERTVKSLVAWCQPKKGVPKRPGKPLECGVYTGPNRVCKEAFLTMPKFFCAALNQPIDGGVSDH
jgi:hypothetical protein